MASLTCQLAIICQPSLRLSVILLLTTTDKLLLIIAAFRIRKLEQHFKTASLSEVRIEYRHRNRQRVWRRRLIDVLTADVADALSRKIKDVL